jgi:hypothetical protein
MLSTSQSILVHYALNQIESQFCPLPAPSKMLATGALLLA